MRVKPIDDYVFDEDQSSTTLAKEDFLNEKVSNIETVGLLDDIHDAIFPNSVDAQLRDMNLSKDELGRILGISIDDDTVKIDSISQRSNKDGKIVYIKMYNPQTGEYDLHTYYLIYKDGKYIMDYIIHPDSIENGFTDDNEIQKVKRIAHLDDNFEVISYENVDDGKKVKVKDDQGRIYYCFIRNNDVLSHVIFPDGSILNCEISNERRNQIDELRCLNENVDIFGYQTIEIDGKNINFYAVGDTSLKKIYDQGLNIQSAINSFPNYSKDLFLHNSDFFGFFIGSKEDSTHRPSGIDWVAYANSDKFIYFDSNDNYAFTLETIEHEMGHIIDYIIGGNKHNTTIDPNFLALYDKYKVSIITAFDGFGGYGGFSEMPNEKELFAKATAIYINKPDELRASMPDLYDYMDKALRGT